ncbi:penicillin-binding protein [Hymenobacter properus]|uniref:Transpeptidase family protein n=1 Tax=Hymenobacter properus TaxID=2791026 RepID=A0A931FK02_9BACT|nr:penicillin-binding protein [Hymenobacter properus]MBF9140521.1 transpeptidase family protein [Hymenobacter properus]MBR7719328.1 transpeptidase family protein [Microvirga sp. SRT04]
MKGSVKKSIVTRVRLAFLGVAVFSSAIFWKATKIQFQEGAKWRALEQERRISYQAVPATRGNIYSDNESIMATSLPFYRVAWDPGVVDDEVFKANVDSLAYRLSHFFGDRSVQEYKRRLINARTAKMRYIRLNSRQINFQEKKLLANWPIFRAKRNRGGAIFEKVDKRFRPFGGLAQRTIGFVNEDKHGAGLEYTFEQSLAGKPGEALFERVPGGVKPVFDGTEIKPLPGYDIKTTLDINLQDVAENALYKSLVDNNAQYGCVILMEVATGEIKAVANLGKASDDTYKEDYNYAFADQGRTEPGSTFKLASMMALFEARPEVTLDDMVDTGNGRMYVGGAVKSDSHGYGRITVQQVFEKSSNIGVAKLVDKYFSANPTEYTDYLKKFGLDKPLGFQMAGEALPYVKDPKDRSWSRTSLTTMSIGYELKLAPLQTLAFYNAVANGGVKMQPMIVREIKQADQVLQRNEPRVLNQKICSDATLAKVKAMMEGVVLAGTARSIRPKDYSIAGKTGTAWKFKNGQYTKTYSTSFCGYFPADKPKYSCIVVVDSPRNGRIYGADVAAPVFREVADKCMARDLLSQRPLLAKARLNKSHVPLVRAGMQDELALVCQKLGLAGNTQATGGEEWVRAASDTAFHARTVALVVNPVRTGRVPQVRGLSLRDALFLLENRGLHVRAVGTGRVREQSLAVGTPIKRGDIITLNLAESGPRLAAPQALPEPEHTDLAENKLLVPAEMEAAAKERKSFTNREKANVQTAVAEHSAGVKPNAKAAKPAASSTAKSAASGAKTTDKAKVSNSPKEGRSTTSDKNNKKNAPKPVVRRA